MEAGPGANPRKVIAPRFRPGHGGRIGEPEGAGLGDVKPILSKEDRRKLSARAGVVPADADAGVDWHGREDLVDLEIERLLQADHIGILAAVQVENIMVRRFGHAFSPSFAVPYRMLNDIIVSGSRGFCWLWMATGSGPEAPGGSRGDPSRRAERGHSPNCTRFRSASIASALW